MHTLNPSIKYHLLLAVLIGLWVYYYNFYIQPFNYSSLYFDWNHLSISFGVIAFVSYAIVTFGQYLLFTKTKKWHLSLEVGAVLLFLFIFIGIAYPYYTISFIGSYDFLTFVSMVLKSAVIVVPFIFLARRYLIKRIPIGNKQITIKGDNKLDILKLLPSDLVCISNSQNYVEVFYIQNGQLSSKLIRASLKKMHEDHSFLMQTHRSHLINPSHLVSWKDQNTIQLTHMVIPVSKNYKDRILAL